MCQYTIGCTAPEELFATDEANVPEEFWLIVDRMGGLRCDGGGLPGSWCHGCEFMEEVEAEDVEH